MGLFTKKTKTEKQIDPVCGMSVDPAKAAATREHDGQRFYFCSKHCAEAFDADPHRYGHPQDAVPESHEGHGAHDASHDHHH